MCRVTRDLQSRYITSSMRSTVTTLILAALLVGCRTAPVSPACTSDCGEIVTQPPPTTCESGSCQPCAAASECVTGICHESGRCEAPACATDDACPDAEICDGGQCVPVEVVDASTCGVGAVSFALDSAKLSPSNQQRLVDAIPCLLEQLAGGELEIAAHGDALGSDDYQRSLARRRVESIQAFLLGRGLPDSRIRGIDEPRGGARSATLTISVAAR